MRSYDYSMGPARPRSSLFLTHVAMSCSSPLKKPRRGWCVAEQQGMFITYASAPGRTASDRGEICGSTGGRICKARSRSSQSIPEHERICAGLDGRCAAALGEQRARPSGISHGSTSSSGPPTVSVDSQRSRASLGTYQGLESSERFRGVPPAIWQGQHFLSPAGRETYRGTEKRAWPSQSGSSG